MRKVFVAIALALSSFSFAIETAGPQVEVDRSRDMVKEPTCPSSHTRIFRMEYKTKKNKNGTTTYEGPCVLGMSSKKKVTILPVQPEENTLRVIGSYTARDGTLVDFTENITSIDPKKSYNKDSLSGYIVSGFTNSGATYIATFTRISPTDYQVETSYLTSLGKKTCTSLRIDISQTDPNFIISPIFAALAFDPENL